MRGVRGVAAWYVPISFLTNVAPIFRFFIKLFYLFSTCISLDHAFIIAIALVYLKIMIID